MMILELENLKSKALWEHFVALTTIPREAAATLVLDRSHVHILKALLSTAEAECREDLGTFDPGLRIAVEETKRPSEVFDPDEMKRVVGLLRSLSHGVLSMSPDIPGLVQTSTNLASIRTEGNLVEILTSQRSAIRSSLDRAAAMVATSCEMAGFEVVHSWKISRVET